MKIRIQLRHTDNESDFRDEFEMDIAEYDALSYPEDILHAKIWELRNNITEEIMRRDRKATTGTTNAGDNTVTNNE